MQLTFPPDKSVELSFKVNIAGTNSVPSSVMLVLELNSTALSFKAIKTEDTWIAIIDNPGSVFAPGPVNLSVNVVVNNRLFTPMKCVATIEQPLADIAATTPLPEPIANTSSASAQINELPNIANEEIFPKVEQPKMESVQKTVVDAAKVSEKPKLKPMMKELNRVNEKILKPEISNSAKQVKEITEIFKSTPISKESINRAPLVERVTIPPIKLQLLKSIEKGPAKPQKTPAIIEEVKVQIEPKNNKMTIKKVRVVYL